MDEQKNNLQGEGQSLGQGSQDEMNQLNQSEPQVVSSEQSGMNTDPQMQQSSPEMSQTEEPSGAVYQDSDKKRTWLVVVIWTVFALVLIGMLIMIFLVSLKNARDKSYERVNDAVKDEESVETQEESLDTKESESILIETEASTEENQMNSVDEMGMSTTVENDISEIIKASEFAKSWQSDAVAVTMLIDETDLNMVTFKSENRPGKAFIVGVASDGTVSASGEVTDSIEGENKIDLEKIKISSSEAYTKIDKAIKDELKLDVDRYERVFFLSNITDENGQNINVWACTLFNTEDENDTRVVVVDAMTGEVEFE